MKEILDKISSYNVFNYLLPGVLFAAFAKGLTNYSFLQSDILVGLFLYYFIGLVISRVGSLLIEPALKSLSLVSFAPYKDFVAASAKDSKLETLSEANNMYRTLSALAFLLLLLCAFEKVAATSRTVAVLGPYLGICALLVLFIFSHRKQTRYINERIAAVLKG